MKLIKLFSKLSSKAFCFSCVLLLTSCASVAPLDPIIGDAGKPLSDIALKSDVIRYELELEIFPGTQSIAGIGSTEFLIIENTNKLELKLDSRFAISKILVDETPAKFERVGGLIIIGLSEERATNEKVTVAVHYSGKPHIAVNAPWAGGFVWSNTEDGLPWIATAVQGEGCDLFWPCKDHFSDKADEMRILLTVPNNVSAVTNGVLQKVNVLNGDRHQFDWLLSVPASDYNISLNVGPFSRIQKTYSGVAGVDIPLEFGL